VNKLIYGDNLENLRKYVLTDQQYERYVLSVYGRHHRSYLG
jgi:hypothetical protein